MNLGRGTPRVTTPLRPRSPPTHSGPGKGHGRSLDGVSDSADRTTTTGTTYTITSDPVDYRPSSGGTYDQRTLDLSDSRYRPLGRRRPVGPPRPVGGIEILHRCLEKGEEGRLDLSFKTGTLDILS